MKEINKTSTGIYLCAVDFGQPCTCPFYMKPNSRKRCMFRDRVQVGWRGHPIYNYECTNKDARFHYEMSVKL